MTITAIIAASVRSALSQTSMASCDRDSVATAAANNAASCLLADPVTMLSQLVQYLQADIHVWSTGPRLSISIKVRDDDAVADIAALIGGPEPVLRFHEGREWMESSVRMAEATVEITSQHRQRCVCKGAA